jgi:hypothetical protein
MSAEPGRAVLQKYKQLLKLIKRMPAQQVAPSLQEARQKMREGSREANPEQRLAKFRDLTARVGYMRIITPRLPGEVESESGTFVLHGGDLVRSHGEPKATSRQETLDA